MRRTKFWTFQGPEETRLKKGSPSRLALARADGQTNSTIISIFFLLLNVCVAGCIKFREMSKANVRFCEVSAASSCADCDQEVEVSFGFLRCQSSYMMRLQADQHALHPPLTIEYQPSTQYGDLAVRFVGDVLEIILFAKSPGKFSDSVSFFHAGLLLKSFNIKANVLPVSMGTPALKDNVMCVSKGSEESETSDWQGF
jgi:hypothetical protein